MIEAVEVLPRLFSSILIPAVVGDELSHPKTPAPVRSWIGHPPAWLNIGGPGALPATASPDLHHGERQAIALALQRGAALLIDDREAVLEARRVKLEAIGTLAVLVRSAQHGWLELPEMFGRLRATSFRSPVHLMARLLEEDALRKK